MTRKLNEMKKLLVVSYKKSLIQILSSFCILKGSYPILESDKIPNYKNTSQIKLDNDKSFSSSSIITRKHQLPKDQKEYNAVKGAYWTGLNLYKMNKYNESVPYFLKAEQYYLPESLYYLNEMKGDFNLISRKYHDEIRLIFLNDKDLKELMAIYEERLSKLYFFNGKKPYQIQKPLKPTTIKDKHDSDRCPLITSLPLQEKKVL